MSTPGNATSKLSFEAQIELAAAACRPRPGSKVPQGRTNPRFEAPGLTAVCTVIHPGGTQHQESVPVVDCSANGMKIVWPGFIHIGTKTEIEISRAGQTPIVTGGTCCWCRFLSGRYHAIGIELDEPLPIRDIVSQEEWLATCAKNPELQKPLAGRVLVFTTTDIAFHALKFQLTGGKLSTSRVDTRGAFLDAIERGDAEILVIDADDDSIDASELLNDCRAHSFTGPIVLTSMDRETEYLSKMDPLGRCRAILLPMQPSAITNALRDIIREHPECAIDTSPIYSDAPPCHDRENMLETFIAQARQLIKAGTQQLADDNLEQATKVVRALAATGGSHGYRPPSDAAERFLAASKDPGMQRRLPSIMQALGSVVMRLDASGNQAA